MRHPGKSRDRNFAGKGVSYAPYDFSRGFCVAGEDTAAFLEKALSDQQIIEILAKGNREEINTIAKEIRGVDSVEISEGKEEGTVSAKITAKSGEDIREKVFRGFAKADCPLLMLKSSQTSIEDVFLELTQSSNEDTDIDDEEVAEDAGNL